MFTRSFITSVVRLGLLALGLGVAACDAGGAADQGVATPPRLTFQDLKFRVYRGPLLAAEGQAARASFRRDTGEVQAEKISARFPDEPARPETRLEAGQGRGNVRERWFAGSDGVRALQPGQVSTTSEARWSAADGIVRGDQPVVVRRGRLVVRGPGFTIDPKDQKIVIDGGAQAVAEGR